MKIPSIGLGLIASLLLAGCGGGGSSTTPSTTKPVVNSVLSTAVVDGGPAFISSSQRTVYTFNGDTTNVSNCTGQCAAIWPPVAPPVTTLAAPWASFTRTDGSMQLSYNGQPLYTFTGDTQPGQANGNGLNGFSIARPLSSPGNGVPSGDPGYNP